MGGFFSKIRSALGKASFDPTQAPPTEGELQARTQRHPPGWMYVKTLDEQGRILSEGWEFKAPPDRFEKDGQAHLPSYIEKLFASQNWFSSVSASTLDGEKGISIWKQEGEIQLSEIFQASGPSDSEKRARSICREEGFPISEDYVTDNSDRIVAWTLPSDPYVVVEILKRFASEVHGIPTDAGLEIRFEEHRDEREKYADVSGTSIHFTYPIQDYSAPPPETTRK